MFFNGNVFRIMLKSSFAKKAKSKNWSINMRKYNWNAQCLCCLHITNCKKLQILYRKILFKKIWLNLRKSQRSSSFFDFFKKKNYQLKYEASNNTKKLCWTHLSCIFSANHLISGDHMTIELPTILYVKKIQRFWLSRSRLKRFWSVASQNATFLTGPVDFKEIPGKGVGTLARLPIKKGQLVMVRLELF